MGLYLAVFASDSADEELDGVEVGSYADFGRFRECAAALEGGTYGARFPVLLQHVDSDGVWSAAEAGLLVAELRTIGDEFTQLPPVEFPDGWQREIADSMGVRPTSLAGCFIDVDGKPLIDRLIGLASLAHDRGLPVWFQ